MAANRDRLSLKLAILLLSTLLSVLAAEWAYRIKLVRSRRRIDYTYRVTPNVPVDYDEKYGEHPKPNLENWNCFIRGGRVAWGSVVTHSNSDGLDGKTTLDEYKAADFRIVVFGDSFSHWNQEGTTWPDLLQRDLGRDLGNKVAVLDYARGGYGILQMLDLAADTIDKVHPDLAIIAAIGDDFSRARWWSKAVEKDGVTRFMLSSKKNDFDDYRFAVDQVLVVPEATRHWCEEELVHHNARESTLEKANRQFAKIQQQVEGVRKPIPFLSWDHSFLLKRLFTGSPYRFAETAIPRLSITDFRKNSRASSDVMRIATARTCVILVYLPTMEELKSRTVVASHQDLLLMRSLERMLNVPFRLVQREYDGELPAKMDLLPVDGHPNRRGLELYATVIARMILQKLRHNESYRHYSER